MNNLLKTVSFTDAEVRRVRFDYRSLQRFREHLRPTVFLGLGGGGSQTVGYIKTLFDRTFGGKDEPGAERIPSHLQFRAFDSDNTQIPTNLGVGSEWFQLESAGLSGGVWEDLAKSERYRDWVAQKMGAQDLGAGCKGSRGLGRFLLQQNIDNFAARIKSAYSTATAARQQGAEKGPVFYIFCTLAGGTGSGCLLDACFHLRAEYARAEIRGFLALAEGFGENTNLIRRAKVGVYAAMREVDHFMSAPRLQEWLAEHHGGKAAFNFQSGCPGRYAKPFDLAFLFTPVTGMERQSLRDARAVSRFMARSAFALTAWPSDGDADAGAGMTFESHKSNFDTELIIAARGSNTSYLVPGYGSIHTPVEEVGDLFALESAQRVIDWLRHGAGNPKHMEEAETFLADLRLTNERLLDTSRELLSLDGALAPERSSKKLEDLTGILKSSKRRHREDENVVLFRTFQTMLESRFKEEVLHRILDYAPDENVRREGRLTESQGTTNPALLSFKDTFARFCAAFETQVNGMMVAPQYRGAGVRDFLGDLRTKLNGLRRTMAEQVDGAAGSLRDLLDNHWKPGSEFRRTLENLCKDTGLLDVEFHLVSDFVGDFQTLFINGWDQIEAWINRSAALFLVESAYRHVTARRTQIVEVLDQFDDAATRLDEKINDVVRDLKLQADGLGEDLETINSASLFDVHWRQRYTDRNKLVDPESMVQRAQDAARREAAPSASAEQPWCEYEAFLEKEGYAARRLPELPPPAEWNPLDVTRLHADPLSNPNQQPLDVFICQDIANAMMRVLQPGLDVLSKWEDGVGLRTAFDYASAEGLRSPDTLRDVFNQLARQCQPQADTSMMGSRLNKQVQRLVFFAGPQGISDDLLRSGTQATSINRALSFESHRMALISYNYPIALAGMPRMQTVFKQTYDSYFDDIKGQSDFDEERRKLHCFPKSWEWRDPWEVDETADPIHNTVARAVLVSWALGDKAGLPAGVAALLDQVIAGMDKVATAPRSKSVAVFLAGGSEVWLAPYCEPDLVKNSVGEASAPVKLGRTLDEAMRELIRSDMAAHRGSAEGWVAWFSANKTAIYDDAQLQALRQRLVARAKERVTATDGDERKRWKLVEAEARGAFVFQV